MVPGSWTGPSCSVSHDNSPIIQGHVKYRWAGTRSPQSIQAFTRQQQGPLRWGWGRKEDCLPGGCFHKEDWVRRWVAVLTGLRRLTQVSMFEAQIENIMKPCFSQGKTKLGTGTVAQWVEHSPSVHNALVPSPPSFNKKNQVQWGTTMKLRQKDNVQDHQGYISSVRPAWGTWTLPQNSKP